MLDLAASEFRLFLVALGTAHEADVRDPTRTPCYPARGLLLRQPVAGRAHIELFIRSSGDLLAFADLTALSILKPVCLPLTIAEVVPGRINADLSADIRAYRLATSILGAIAPVRHPAPSAGSATATSKGDR